MHSTRKGFTFRNPAGNLDYRVVDTVAAAQSNAAFASERRYSHISMPSDWDRAYKQGFRIVPVTMKAERTRRSYKLAAPQS
jgi:hypothetical protein